MTGNSSPFLMELRHFPELHPYMPKGLIFCLLWNLLPLLSIGQVPGHFPQLRPAPVITYDTDRGLPFSCIAGVFFNPRQIFSSLWGQKSALTYHG
ncbi:MAG: hypothetical protein R3D58_08760 [Saprospiraceae bacterium]|jgi:hypothetical protein